MTKLIDKVKTLIEYANFGVFICKNIHNKTGELFFPRAVNRYIGTKNEGYQKTATFIGGYLTEIGGQDLLIGNTTVKEINLPECTSLGSYNWSNSMNPNVTLKKLCLPKLRVLYNTRLIYLKGLEYLELGSLEVFGNKALEGCTELKEIYIGKGTNSSIYVYGCEKLTQESLHSMIECFVDRTGLTSLTFHIGGFNFTKIDEEHIAMLDKKNIEVK
jgi:hypothetical protein